MNNLLFEVTSRNIQSMLQGRCAVDTLCCISWKSSKQEIEGYRSLRLLQPGGGRGIQGIRVTAALK